MDRSRIRRAFDRAAPGFTQVGFLHSELRGRLLERLSFIRIEPEWILDLGAATGAGTGALAELFPESRIVALDWSIGMLREFDAAASGSGEPCDEKSLNPISSVCADAHTLPMQDRSIDLIFSNLLLQNYQCPIEMLTEARRVLRYPGVFLFTTLGPDSLQELRRAWQHADRYSHITEFMDMHDLGDALIQAGFAEPVLARESLRVTYPSLPPAIADLRAVGSINSTRERNRGLTSRKAWARLTEAYEQFRDAEGKLPVTIEVIYGLAWSGQRRAGPRSADGEFEFPVGELELLRGPRTPE